MGVCVYLLNISKLKEQTLSSALWKRAEAGLDAERRSKLSFKMRGGVRMHSTGAGLLIQYLLKVLA